MAWESKDNDAIKPEIIGAVYDSVTSLSEFTAEARKQALKANWVPEHDDKALHALKTELGDFSKKAQDHLEASRLARKRYELQLAEATKAKREAAPVKKEKDP